MSLQRVLQAYSDPFLGHLAGVKGDYYVRQFHDMKGGIDAGGLDDAASERFVEACAVVLARAHAQSGLSAEILGYVGRGGRLTSAILDWCHAYTATVKADFEAFLAQP
ncbi:DUF2252 family protein [Tessaracoccus sp. HDW20]|uniref:DUF2252 family protein n=1 Tax=Tessaracoccus coleopterorum TaxID=2714950 RepID=UPI0018D3FE82|nr:DUF2252 family protein [Tessaracoccus coleopterorum]